jgi:hypothetical protein
MTTQATKRRKESANETIDRPIATTDLRARSLPASPAASRQWQVCFVVISLADSREPIDDSLRRGGCLGGEIPFVKRSQQCAESWRRAPPPRDILNTLYHNAWPKTSKLSF